MSKQGCLDYIMERRTGASRPQKKSLMVNIDKLEEDLRLKRELENDDFSLRGVNLTEMGTSSSVHSENGRKGKNANFGQHINLEK